MALGDARTLIEAIPLLPRGDARGFRFRTHAGEDHFYPFAAMEAEARRRAALLATLGLRKGDRVALVLAEPEEFVLTFVAASFAGLVPVPIYPRASFKAKNSYVETVAHIVRAADCKVLVTMAATQPIIEEVLAQGVGLEQLVILEDLLKLTAQPFDFPRVDPNDLCFLQFTSGSTSMPKGVMVTHGNLVANARAFLSAKPGLDCNVDDLAVGWLPLYHDMGLIGFVLGTLIRDIQVMLLPTEAFARRPNLWMETISKYRGTITFAPNFAYALAAKRARDKDLEGLDLSCLRVAGCGAEPINAQVMRDFATRFAPVGFNAQALMPAYGMAESTLAISFHQNPAALITDTVDADAMKRGQATPATTATSNRTEVVCCGTALLDHDIKIVDEAGNAQPERSVGEILARGPSVTVGYYNNKEATDAAYRDGWLHTGDLGYVANGQLYICGRIKDLIIIRGANHYPQDIEWAISELPGVRRDNVVAFSVMRDGEEQLIVAAEANSADAAQLRISIAEKVGETTGLKVGHVAVVRVGSLPKTSSGKAQRRRTKTMFEDGTLEEHPT